MNDKELIEELREYATALRASVHVPHTGADLIERGADALAARQPTEDGELAKVEAELAEWLAGKRSWCDQHHGKPDEIELTAKADEATIRLLIVKRDALRAAVPDAATGRFECDRDCLRGGSPIEECSAHGRTPRDLWERLDELVADRDAALAAVERVRAIAKDGAWRDTKTPGDWVWALDHMAHKILAALDGAPEPEWEYECRRSAPWDWRACDSGPKLCPEGNERRRRVAAGPWLPVEGESKP